MSALRWDRGWRDHWLKPQAREPEPVRPRSLTHLEHDALGHHASRLREQQRKAWRRAQWTWHKQRRHDLDAIFAARYRADGSTVPRAAEMEAAARAMAYHLNGVGGPNGLRERLEGWFDAVWPVGIRRPEDEPDFDVVVAEVQGRRLDLGARRCGAILALSWIERQRLGIRTIRNCDMTDAEFRAAAAERKRENDRERAALRRRREGQVARDQYRWQGDREPWLYLGVSRSTWDRRKRVGNLSSLVAACTIPVPDWLSDFCLGHDAEVSQRSTLAAPDRDGSVSQVAEGSPAVRALPSTAEASPVTEVGEADEKAVGWVETASSEKVGRRPRAGKHLPIHRRGRHARGPFGLHAFTVATEAARKPVPPDLAMIPVLERAA